MTTTLTAASADLAHDFWGVFQRSAGMDVEENLQPYAFEHFASRLDWIAQQEDVRTKRTLARVCARDAGRVARQIAKDRITIEDFNDACRKVRQRQAPGTGGVLCDPFPDDDG